MKTPRYYKILEGLFLVLVILLIYSSSITRANAQRFELQLDSQLIPLDVQIEKKVWIGDSLTWHFSSVNQNSILHPLDAIPDSVIERPTIELITPKERSYEGRTRKRYGEYLAPTIILK